MADDDKRPRQTIAARIEKWVSDIRGWDHSLPPGKGPLCFVLVCIGSERGAEELSRVDASPGVPAIDVGARVECVLLDLAGEYIDTKDGWSARIFGANSNGDRITGGLPVRVTAAHRDAAQQNGLTAASTGAPTAVERASFIVATGFAELQQQSMRAVRYGHDEIARRDTHHRELLMANVEMAKALSGALGAIVAQSNAAVSEANERARKAEEREREATERARKAERDLETAVDAVEKSAKEVEDVKKATTVVGGIVNNVLKRNGVTIDAEAIGGKPKAEA